MTMQRRNFISGVAVSAVTALSAGAVSLASSPPKIEPGKADAELPVGTVNARHRNAQGFFISYYIVGVFKPKSHPDHYRASISGLPGEVFEADDHTKAGCILKVKQRLCEAISSVKPPQKSYSELRSKPSQLTNESQVGELDTVLEFEVAHHFKDGGEIKNERSWSHPSWDAMTRLLSKRANLQMIRPAETAFATQMHTTKLSENLQHCIANWSGDRGFSFGKSLENGVLFGAYSNPIRLLDVGAKPEFTNYGLRGWSGADVTKKARTGWTESPLRSQYGELTIPFDHTMDILGYGAHELLLTPFYDVYTHYSEQERLPHEISEAHFDVVSRLCNYLSDQIEAYNQPFKGSNEQSTRLNVSMPTVRIYPLSGGKYVRLVGFQLVSEDTLFESFML